MRTKNIFKALALAMLMPAMLLTTACSNQDDVVNNTAENTVTNKGYALPVTVNVTRQGDGTRATFDGSKLNFGAGDKLFVEGKYATGSKSFAGELTWQSGGTFSGTIYAQDNTYSTYDALLTAASSVTATLLPNYYESTGFLSINNNSTTGIAYDDRLTVSGSYAFVASETAKATGVEQLSLEQASTYSSAFALSPGNAILNFTITGLEAGAKDVLLHIHHGFDYDVFGSVTPNASGVATFAVGVPVGANIKDMDNNLTVGTHNFTLPSTTLAAGKIYNITRGPGKFTINSSGTKVVFSPGNLQYQASTDTWRFAEHQYDYVGDDTNGNVYVGTTKSNNASIGETYTGWIDLFGWGTSGKTISNYGSAYQPWSTSTTYTDYGPTGTYNLTGTYANGDWGVNIGTGWRTLTGSSGGEWEYLFNKRTTTSGILYAKATVNGVSGVILLPDDWSESYHSLTSYNTTSVAYDTNTISESDWSSNFEAHGCVFLPAAGYRRGTSVNNVGSSGNYWSSTASDTESAYCVIFNSGNVYPAVNNIRNYGFSVRLVRPVQPNN